MKRSAHLFTTLAAMSVLILVAADAPSEVDKRVAQKLEDGLPIDFDGNKLVNVLGFFPATTGIRFSIDWTTLEAASYKQDQRITLKLENASAASALKQVLEQAGKEKKEAASYAIIDGTVHISTKAGLEKIAAKTKDRDKK